MDIRLGNVGPLRFESLHAGFRRVHGGDQDALQSMDPASSRCSRRRRIPAWRAYLRDSRSRFKKFKEKRRSTCKMVLPKTSTSEENAIKTLSCFVTEFTKLIVAVLFLL